MLIEILVWSSFALACLPALLVAINLLLYRPAPRAELVAAKRPRVSVLIPARNEERNIDRCLDAVLESRSVDLEVLVLDDDSEDGTAAKVSSRAARDQRLKLLRSEPLPDGWNGKQFACWQLAKAASHDWLLFIDADVVLDQRAASRLTAYAQARRVDLLSGFPRQVTSTPLERLLIPLIHFVLLGFLPLIGMRWSKSAGFAAGCGQLFLARRDAYFSAAGHEAVRASRHDGIQLPRSFRRSGYTTDLVDATDLASCRMYSGASQVWNGLAKNATEGMASRLGIVVWTVLLFGGQVLPFVLLVSFIVAGSLATNGPLVLAACLLAIGTRAALAVRFVQAPLGVLLHPVSVVLLLAIQYYARLREELHRPVAWKGRVHA